MSTNKISKLGGGIVDKVLATQHEDQSWIPSTHIKARVSRVSQL